MASCPADSGKSVMKSIDMDFHGLEGTTVEHADEDGAVLNVQHCSIVDDARRDLHLREGHGAAVDIQATDVTSV